MTIYPDGLIILATGSSPQIKNRLRRPGNQITIGVFSGFLTK
jgi:hypothetical protein